MNSSLSGIRAANTQMAVRAHNIANVNTNGFKSSRAVQVETPGGGTKISSVDKKDSPPASKLEVGNDGKVFGAKKNYEKIQVGQLVPSDVDLAKEMTGMIPEEKSLAANVRSIQVKDRMLGDLLDLFG